MGRSPLKIALRRGHSLRESRNPFRFECHGPKGGILTPGLAETRTLDHVTTLLADPGRLLF